MLAFGVPSIPLPSPEFDVFDVEIDIVDAQDDAPIFDLARSEPTAEPSAPDAALPAQQPPELAVGEVGAPLEPEPGPESDPDTLSAIEQLQRMIEQDPVVDVPEVENDQTLEQDSRLDPSNTPSIEIEVDKTVFDPTQEASLGRGADAAVSELTPDEAAPELPADPTREEIQEQTVAGGDAQALLDALATLSETQIQDVTPAPDKDVIQAVIDQFGEPTVPTEAAENPEPDAGDETPQPNSVDPTDENAENVFATLPVPKVRPTRAPTYIDTEAPEDQVKLVSAARRVFDEPAVEPTPDAPVTEVGDTTSGVELGSNASAGDGGVGASTQGGGDNQEASAIADAEQAAQQAARDAANRIAKDAIDARINIDWPVFALAQYGWVVRGTVRLRNIEGDLLDLEARVSKAPSNATDAQIASVEQAVKRAVAASFPWRIPADYAEDWIEPIVFEYCPQTSALTSGSGC